MMEAATLALTPTPTLPLTLILSLNPTPTPNQGLSTLCPRTRTYEHGGEVSNLVARAMLEATPRAVLAIQNAGGCRKDIGEGVFTMVSYPHPALCPLCSLCPHCSLTAPTLQPLILT